jgi:hypothetical protein
MEELFQLIFENIGVVIVLAAVAGPLWKHMRRQGQSEAGRKVYPMPSFGGMPTEPRKQSSADEDWRERPDAFGEEDARRSRERAEEKENRDMERLLREWEASGEGVSLEGQGLAEPPSRSRLASSSGLPLRKENTRVESIAGQSGTVSEGFQPEKDDLIKAVVWSEILGPPRFKRPYRRS